MPFLPQARYFSCSKRYLPGKADFGREKSKKYFLSEKAV
jgi:hypothetical protein